MSAKVATLLKGAFGDVLDGPDAWRVSCPFCAERGQSRNDTKSRLYVYRDSLMAHCFNCGLHSTVASAIARATGATFGSVSSNLRGEAATAAPRRVYSRLRGVAVSEKVDYVNGLGLSRAGYRYLRGRGIPRYRLLESRVKADSDFVYFPFLDVRDGTLTYWQSRSLHGKRFDNPTSAMGFLPMSYHLWGLWSARFFRDWVIVESITDALVVGRRAVALSGKALSTHQKQWFGHYRPKTVTLLLDSDAGVSHSLRVGAALREMGLVVYVASAEDDPASDGLRKIQEALWRRVSLLEFTTKSAHL